MKFGKNIQDLLKEVERQSDSRKDYSAPTPTLTMEPVTHHGAKTNVVVAMKGNGTLPATSLAHRQIGEHVGVPAKYYDRMRQEAPELLATNVNHWFQEQPSQRLVRTLDGNIRAFLSQGFRALDYFDLCEAAVPTLTRQGMQMVSCKVTETRLYIKAVNHRVVRQVEGKRIVDGKMVEFEDISPSCTISNSEVGMGALSIERGIFQHRCKNMSIFTERALRKYHVGVRHNMVENVELLSDKTKNLTNAALWSQVKDVIGNSFAGEQFNRAVAQINGMQTDKITSDVVRDGRAGFAEILVLVRGANHRPAQPGRGWQPQPLGPVQRDHQSGGKPAVL